MKNRIIKFTVLMSVFTFILATTAFAALPNMYGKNYKTVKKGHICSMTASGDKDIASTVVENTANSKRYYSAHVNRRHADGNKIIEKSTLEKLVPKKEKITVSVTRYRSDTDREYYHKAMSWNCSMRPEGAGYTNFLDDTLTYTVKQSK